MSRPMGMGASPEWGKDDAFAEVGVAEVEHNGIAGEGVEEFLSRAQEAERDGVAGAGGMVAEQGVEAVGEGGCEDINADGEAVIPEQVAVAPVA